MARVVLEHLTKIFDQRKGNIIRAVDDVSLTVEEKELLVLVGPSGCGKTTTLRLIAGLEEPTGGTISIDGEIISDLTPKERDIAMVFQNFALYPHMSGYENIAFGLKLRKYPKAEIEQRVKEAAQLLDLTGCLDRKPSELSGGQRQRLALGRAIVRKPRVFLLDEPLSNLDAPMRLQMRAEIARLHHRLGSTMIYVTHDQIEAMNLGDRIAVMKDGALHQVGDPMTIYQRPPNMFVAGFIGSPPMNFFRGTVVQNGAGVFFQENMRNGEAGKSNYRLRLDEEDAARMSNSISKEVVLGIRPENIRETGSTPDAAGDHIVEGIAELIMPIGSETHLHLASGAHSFIVRVPPSTKVAVNQKIPVVFEMRHAHFFDPTTQNRIT